MWNVICYKEHEELLKAATSKNLLRKARSFNAKFEIISKDEQYWT